MKITRDEIENALLTTGVVEIDAGGGSSIELDQSGKRLAKVVFDHLRSSTVDDLSKSTEFFDALEAAFCDEPKDLQQESGTNEKGTEAEKEPDRRTWRLQKVETRGFGGLNALPDDIFEFDVAGQDFCIEGQNGSGKSSLANAILFAMTGKIYRDQFGLWDDPARSEPVMSDDNVKLGDWPPIATYPGNWECDHLAIDLMVILTFGNKNDGEEITATRRLHGKLESLEHEVSIDPKLTAVPALIEASLLMPMRIQHIRVTNNEDNNELVGLIRQLLGLEPLLDVANLAGKLTHGGQRFMKYAQENKLKEKADRISDALRTAQERIKDLDKGIDLNVEFEAQKPVIDSRLKKLVQAKSELDRLQAKGFEELALLASNGFDPKNSEHRRHVTEAINHLHLDAKRQSEPRNQPPVLRAIESLAKHVEDENFVALKLALQKASADLDAASKWAGRQKEDVLLRLKAVAAEHFEENVDPLCPLCRQSIGGSEHQDLVEELRILKADAEKAQTQLDDACRRVEQDVRSAAQPTIPNNLMGVERFAVKRNIQNQVLQSFVEADHVASSLPRFADIAKQAVEAAFEMVEEFEFGSELPEPENGDHVGHLRRLLDHLEITIAAAECWQHSRQAFWDAWTRLFSAKDKRSLASHILRYKGMIETVEPFQSASEHIQQALLIVGDYNKITSRQALRENIAQALKPLHELRNLVNLTTHRTINDVSDTAKKIHGQIYNPEALTYEKANVSVFRGKQSLKFQAKLGNNLNWWIDSSLLANMSWMRGILWSFVFAVRKQAISRSGHCPFELMVLDDPQMTFDTRNLKGWARLVGSSDGLRQHQPCQFLISTHSMPFASEMTAMHDIQMAKIETGQPWSNPAQVVRGDFAAVRFKRMLSENSDELARELIGAVRVLAETLLKHAIKPFDPEFVCKPEATLGGMIKHIKDRKEAKIPPYTAPEFSNLIGKRSSHPDLFDQLNEVHHSLSEAITVHEAQRVYRFWTDTLFPAIRDVWEVYRFLQKPAIGEVTAIQLPANCNHKPLRSNALASVQPVVRGRVSAYADGRVASAIQIDAMEEGNPVNLKALAAYRLEKDTLSPVARIGDILLTRLDAQCRASNLVVEDRGEHLIARRWHEDRETPALAVLAASSSNPREVPSAVISRAEGANRRKIVGVLFAAEMLQPGDKIKSDTEATALDAKDKLTAALVADTSAFEVQGYSAEPIALDKQFLLAKPAKSDFQSALDELDGKPVIAEDSEGCAFFKRLRYMSPSRVILESLDKSGSEGLISLSVDPNGPSPYLTSIREVVGVVFDKL